MKTRGFHVQKPTRHVAGSDIFPVGDSCCANTRDKLLNWKEVNDTTGRIGGWRAYAKEARQADDKAPAHDMSKMPEPKTEGGKP